MGADPADLFLTSAEIAVAFIGFASLVGVASRVLSRQSYREAFATHPTERSPIGWIMLAGDFLSLAALIANATGWPAEPSLAVYFAAGVVWHLVGSALAFRGVVALAWSGEG